MSARGTLAGWDFGNWLMDNVLKPGIAAGVKYGTSQLGQQTAQHDAQAAAQLAAAAEARKRAAAPTFGELMREWLPTIAIGAGVTTVGLVLYLRSRR